MTTMTPEEFLYISPEDEIIIDVMMQSLRNVIYGSENESEDVNVSI
jgi:hypothetical protein